MEAHIAEWANLLVRWIHFIVGVAWIGASFYFNWLENHLNRSGEQEPGIAGNLWAVHGGGFYHLKKYQTAPEKLPETLHWFKWEAYMTWVSGITLLAVVYYYNSQAMMLDQSVPANSPLMLISIGVGSMLVSWIIYDVLCKSSLKDKPVLLGVILYAYLAVLIVLLMQVFSARAAYIHWGAAIGTIMVANVFFGIIPAQKELVKALQENRTPDPKYGKSGLLRSRHNNYLTLPVLLIMISNHFPSTYGSEHNVLILIALSSIGVFVRHYYNIRHINKTVIWMLPTAICAFALVVMATKPEALGTVDSSDRVTTEQIMPLVKTHCIGCHSVKPTQAGFASPPAGLAYDDPQVFEKNADKVYSQVSQKIMPLANLTGMTDEERMQIKRWYQTLKQDTTHE